jgi:hypothetical protein
VPEIVHPPYCSRTAGVPRPRPHRAGSHSLSPVAFPVMPFPRLRPAGRRALAAGMLALATACAGRKADPSGQPRADSSNRNVITQEQMVQQHFRNAFEAVQALHPNWLSSRGTDSFRAPSQVVVYLDDVRLGGVDQLSSIAPSTVRTIRHFNGVDAAARWGLDHGAGVIQVISRVR